MREQESTRPLPGVFATISAGLDLTAHHLWLLLIPLVLDLFFWLGPRLRFETLIAGLLDMLPAEAEGLDQITQLASIASQTNLFTTLSVQLIGVPVYLAGLAPPETPLVPTTIEIGSWSSWVGLLIIFTVIGLLLTAVYYTLIAFCLVGDDEEHVAQTTAGHWAKRALVSWVRLLGLALLFAIITMILYAPVVVIGSILFLINPSLGSLAVMGGLFLVTWVIVILSMAPFGIVLNGRPLLRAVGESVRLVQKNFSTVIYLLFTIFLIGTLLDWLLVTVENGSWFTLINIAGHAFVSTAVVAALFIFYRDRYIHMFASQTAPEPQSEREEIN